MVSAAALLAGLVWPSNLVASVAAWTDEEFVHGQFGVIDCDVAGNYASRAQGQFLGGGVLPIPLETVADLNAVTVANDGTIAAPSPTSATPVGPDGFANPLQVDALNGLVQLDLTNLLVLPLETDVGAVNQYGRATATGDSAAATGLVNDSGAIAVDTVPATMPDWATLKLSNLVRTATGEAISSLVAGIADVDLSIGAVASSAEVDGCNADYSGDIAANLNRDYLVAGLSSTASTPLVGDLVSTVGSTVTNLAPIVNGLSTSTGLVTAVTNSINVLVGPLLNGLGLGSTQVTIGATADFSAVTALLDDTLTDPTGLVEISLSGGTVTVDLAALLGGPDGLNGLDPNTEIVVNDAAITKLTTALTQVLDAWTTRVLDAVNRAIGLVKLDITATIVLRVDLINSNLATITATATNVSLTDLLAGKVVLNATVSEVVSGGVLGTLIGTSCVLLGVLCWLTTGLISGVASVVEVALESPINGVGQIVGSAVYGLLTPLVTTLGASLASVVNPLVSAVASLYRVLFGGEPGALLSLGVNLQNAPEVGVNPAPIDWTSGDDAITPGQYDIAALRIGVLDALGSSTNINLDLARSSVGPNVPVP
jgi:hypothetical protein